MLAHSLLSYGGEPVNYLNIIEYNSAVQEDRKETWSVANSRKRSVGMQK